MTWWGGEGGEEETRVNYKATAKQSTQNFGVQTQVLRGEKKRNKELQQFCVVPVISSCCFWVGRVTRGLGRAAPAPKEQKSWPPW